MEPTSEQELEALGWKCVKGCGACCYLAPQDRPYLDDLLNPEELATFRGLLGPDGWCRHFNTKERICGIYEDRPAFCRVKTWLASKADGFGVNASDKAELGAFCADCCREHVSEVYGIESEEMVHFNAEVTVTCDSEVVDEADDDGLIEGYRVAEEYDPSHPEPQDDGDSQEWGSAIDWEEAEEWEDDEEED